MTRQPEDLSTWGQREKRQKSYQIFAGLCKIEFKKEEFFPTGFLIFSFQYNNNKTPLNCAYALKIKWPMSKVK